MKNGTNNECIDFQYCSFSKVSADDTKEGIRGIIEHEEHINYQKRMGVKWTTGMLDISYLTIDGVIFSLINGR